MTDRKAVVLLSGGLDSTTTAAVAKGRGFALYALTFDYGQRHKVEIEKALEVGRSVGVKEHVVIPVDLQRFGGSALTSDIQVPKSRSLTEIGQGIPVTYVPARNTIFLSFALAWAEVLEARDIFIGVNVLDASGYPDCRADYIAAYERMANLATKAGVEGRGVVIHTPLIEMTKAEIIRTGRAFGVDYSITSSCYEPSAKGEACGMCDACLLRLKGFRETGVSDPIQYRTIAAVGS
jgi:7-cyano-7-deazaguanine synthase